jgi:hypothetical protein
MRVIGLGRRTRVLTGWYLVTTDGNSSPVIGREVAVGLNMITTGIETMTATTIGITTEVATEVTTRVTAEVTTKVKTTTANSAP